MIENASRDGARYGSVWSSDTEIKQVIADKTISLEPANLTVNIAPSSNNRQRGEKIEVGINYQVPLWAPVWGQILPNPFPISAKTVMRIE